MLVNLTDFRDPAIAQRIAQQIHTETTRPWSIMEICGGQTHAILKSGLDQLLPDSISLIHGPGCPVCVTPVNLIDKALAIAARDEVIFTSFGDMLRVPGSKQDLFALRAAGAQVKVVYAPLDAVKLAAENPQKQVVFFAIGFETTAPANAAAVLQAHALGLKNFSLLVSQVRVPQAMETILSSPENQVQGFLAAGHVCAVMGTREYAPIAARYSTPIVVTGFEPVDILLGIQEMIRQLENGKADVVNMYPRIVKAEGNPAAQRMINQVFQPVDRSWRGIGEIPQSGFGLRDEFSLFDAEKRFELSQVTTVESELCIAGQILQGIKKPHQCPAFASLCKPEHPLGAPMVSNEGACNAYFRYHRD